MTLGCVSAHSCHSDAPPLPNMAGPRGYNGSGASRFEEYRAWRPIGVNSNDWQRLIYWLSGYEINAISSLFPFPGQSRAKCSALLQRHHRTRAPRILLVYFLAM